MLVTDALSYLDTDLGHVGASTNGTTSTAERPKAKEQCANVTRKQKPEEDVAGLDLATLLLVVG